MIQWLDKNIDGLSISSEFRREGCFEERWPQIAGNRTQPYLYCHSLQFELARMYYLGKGVPKDAAKAMEWYQKAAAQGNVKAQAILGVIYAKGEGVSEDSVLAYTWSNLAAAQGDKRAKEFRDLK